MKSQGQIWVFFNVRSQVQTSPLAQGDAHFFVLKMARKEIRHYLAWTPGWKTWVPLKEILRVYPQFFPLPPAPSDQDDEVTDITSPTSVNDDKTVTDPKVRLKTVANSKVRKDTVTNSKIRKDTVTNSSFGEITYTEITLDNEPPQLAGDFEPDGVNWDKTPALPQLDKAVKPTASSDDRRIYKRFPHRIEIVIMTKKGRSFRSSSQNISLGGALLREPVPQDLLRDVMDVVIINPFPDKSSPSHLLFKGRVVGDSKEPRRLMFYDISPEVQKKMATIFEVYKKKYKEHKKKRAA